METIRIGDACKILNGYAFKSDKYVTSGIRVIRIANVQKGYIEDADPEFYPENYSGLDKYMLKEGDLLISLTGNVGRVAILQKEMLPAALNQRVACLRIKNPKISKGYLFHFLNSDYFENKCIQASKGVAQKNVSTEWLKEYEIPLYSAKKQAEIENTLDKLNLVIKHRKEELSDLGELIKARFVEMFGLPGDDNPEWKFGKLGDVCEFNPKKVNNPKLVNNPEVSFVPMNAVSEKGYLDPSEIRSYSDVKTGFTYFEDNDVLFAKITPCMENGKGAVAKGLKNGVGFGSTEFHVLRPVKGVSNPYWIYTLTSFEQFRIQAMKNMTGSAGQRRVPVNFLENYRVAIPPIELQDRFADFVAQVDKSKAAVQKSLDETQLLFDSLMQKYFG